MLKEEVFTKAIENNISITDSQFRRYIQYGLITSRKNSEGKGKGVHTLYPENTIEILSEIQTGTELGFPLKEMIFYLFSKGYLVDIEKLQKTLINHIDTLLEQMEFLIDNTKDDDQREWITEEIVKESLPKKIPGRPSNEKLSNLNDQKEREKGKLNSVLKLMEEIFLSRSISNETAYSFLAMFEYSQKEPKINIPEKWLNSSNWTHFISNSNKEDLEEVQKTLVFFGLYQRFLDGEKVDSYFWKQNIQPLLTFYQNAGLRNFLHDPLLLKLAITLLIVEPSWRKGINHALSLTGFVKDFETLKQTLPPLLNMLDQHLKGAEKESV